MNAALKSDNRLMTFINRKLISYMELTHEQQVGLAPCLHQLSVKSRTQVIVQYLLYLKNGITGPYGGFCRGGGGGGAFLGGIFLAPEPLRGMPPQEMLQI